MKWVLAFALLGCQQKKQDVVVADPPAPKPVVADARAVVAPIDLFAATPATVTVSSRVANAAIKPQHLVDRDLETAWNSVTNELVGAWLDIKVPGAIVTELRMTVGHTGHGPKGEDYFTMNPRIRAVTVTDDGKPAGTFTFDITKREPQKLALRATGTIHVVITDVAMGSQASWREVAISELQAWGTPPATWTAPSKPRTPVVTVAAAPTQDELDPCAGAEAEREAFINEHAHDVNSGPGGEDHNYPPRCDGLDLPEVPAKWRVGAGCRVNDEIYGPKTCVVSFALGAAHTSVEVTEPAQSAEITVESITAISDLHGIAIRFKTPEGDKLAVCRESPLACTRPIQISASDWSTRPRFVTGTLVLDGERGTPPAGTIGTHVLDFK